MDPEAAPRQAGARLFAGGRGRHHPAAHAGLRELYLSAVLADARQFPACADRRHVEPIHRPRHSDRRREHAGDPLPQSARHRLPLPPVNAARQLHVAPQHHCLPRRQDGAGDAAHLHADALAAHGQEEARRPRRRMMNVLTKIDAATDHRRLANSLRMLSVDAVEQAKSGHPGAPMGMADIAEVLWRRYLKHDPADPRWPDRDRFVLSNGHASMLLYALLHLSGYDLSIDELKRFRQLGSKTPGHPEYGVTPGVETSTGPLGQGLANAVGMALAEKLLAAEFNRPGHEIVDHHTYVFLGDGCLMEGVSHESCALAGTWKLGKLIALYDDNGISIDGEVAPWFI